MAHKTLSFWLVGFIFLTGCLGSSSTDSSSQTVSESSGQKTVTGTLTTDSDTSFLMASGSASCTSDIVIATDTSGDTVSSEVTADCSFSLTLNTGKNYVISFALNDEFVATLFFDSGVSGITTPTLPVDNDNGSIDLGSITITGDTATCENNPLEEVDTDGDGTDDYTDEDDDEDGTYDIAEDDCDLDGLLDDYDDEQNCGEEMDDFARVLDVRPNRHRHRHHLWGDLVNLRKKVKARIACYVDPDNLDNENFRVESEFGDQIECDFRLRRYHRHDHRQSKVICRHELDPFESDTTYTATIDGLMCEDGRPVQEVSWSWHTKLRPDDLIDYDGDYEDDLEDELEEENEEADDDDITTNDNSDDDDEEDDDQDNDDSDE